MVWQPGTLPQQTPHRERGNGRESRHQRERQKRKKRGRGRVCGAATDKATIEPT